MTEPEAGGYDFGPFRYDPRARILFRDGNPVPLAPKATDTLHVLLQHRGEVLEKPQLMRLVWPDCVVEEIGLARNISILRKALGDDTGVYIETIPKHGYRFTAAIDRGEGAGIPHPHDGVASWAWPALVVAVLGLTALVYWQFYLPSPYAPSYGSAGRIAVVPVECLSRDLDDAFSQQFAERLIEELSKLKAVEVTSPSTVQRYREFRIPTAMMTRLLGLHVVVEGSAETVREQTHISLRLTDVHSGRLIWAEGYDLPAADRRAQSDVASRAAVSIDRHLGN